MIKIREIIDVKANDDFTLECAMDNGEVYLYDMSYLKDYEGGPKPFLRHELSVGHKIKL